MSTKAHSGGGRGGGEGALYTFADAARQPKPTRDRLPTRIPSGIAHNTQHDVQDLHQKRGIAVRGPHANAQHRPHRLVSSISIRATRRSIYNSEKQFCTTLTASVNTAHAQH